MEINNNTPTELQTAPNTSGSLTSAINTASGVFLTLSLGSVFLATTWEILNSGKRAKEIAAAEARGRKWAEDMLKSMTGRTVEQVAQTTA